MLALFRRQPQADRLGDLAALGPFAEAPRSNPVAAMLTALARRLGSPTRSSDPRFTSPKDQERYAEGIEALRERDVETARQEAAALRRELDDLLGADAAERTVFLGRLGYGRAPTARSLRLPLRRLIVR